jgi:hypothetical protein
MVGDSHNFGRRVELRGDRVHKPRTLLWEWLLLSTRSPLRRALADAAEAAGLGREAFEFLPTLTFRGGRSPRGGTVQRLQLKPLPRLGASKRRELARIVGRSLALWSYLGVADLHWENLALGLDADGRIVFGPLDIEMVLADLSLPTQTKLLPDADPEYAEVCRHAAGVRRVLPYLGKPVAGADLVAMVEAYRSTLDALEACAARLAAVFCHLPELATAPIRVCLRGTEEYVYAETRPIWPPLLAAEREQLDRGDIPYFFRLYGKPGIHYYASRDLEQLGRLPLRGDAPRLEPLLPAARQLRSNRRRQLREDGLFTLLGAFDHAALRGRHSAGGMLVDFGARKLRITLADGSQLETSRKLSAFVGSVYLPCGCGEVKSVFVPAVTRCNA